MSLEQEIIVVIPMATTTINLPNKHREFLYLDEVYNNLDHSTLDTTTAYWDIALTSYSDKGKTYVSYEEILPFVAKPNLLKDYFEKGVGQRIRLLNKQVINSLTELPSVWKEVLEERNLFLANMGSVTYQYQVYDLLTSLDVIDEHMIIMSAPSSQDFLGKTKDAQIVWEINSDNENDPYFTYFSYYNKSQTYLKNQYQIIDSLSRSKATTPQTMNSLWLNNQTSFIDLEEADLKVFANVVNSLGEDINRYFIQKDLTVSLQNAGLTYLALGQQQRKYTNNNINNLAIQFDNTLLEYRENQTIEAFDATTWLPVAKQSQEDIDNKEVKGFVCKYYLPDEIRSVEVGLKSSYTFVE